MVRILKATQAQVAIEGEVLTCNVLGGVWYGANTDNLFVNCVNKFHG